MKPIKTVVLLGALTIIGLLAMADADAARRSSLAEKSDSALPLQMPSCTPTARPTGAE